MSTDADVVKPGVKTSEFATTVASMVVGVAAAVAGVVHPGFHLSATAQATATAAGAGLVAVAGSVYTMARSMLKKASMPVVGDVNFVAAKAVPAPEPIDVPAEVKAALDADPRVAAMELVDGKIHAGVDAAVAAAVGPVTSDWADFKRLFGVQSPAPFVAPVVTPAVPADANVSIAPQPGTVA